MSLTTSQLASNLNLSLPNHKNLKKIKKIKVKKSKKSKKVTKPKKYITFFYIAYPITPHAIREPEFPVIRLSLSHPLPKSSSSACITTLLPITLYLPRNLINLSHGGIYLACFGRDIS